MTFLRRQYYPLLGSGTLGMVVVTLLLMSDMVIAGLFIGEDAVAGINLVTPIYSMAFFFVGLVSLGVPVLYSNAMGRFDKQAADDYFANGLTAAVITGLVLFAAVLLAGESFLKFFHPAQSVLEQAEPYLFWYRFVILILPVNYILSEMVLADGDDALSTLSNTLQVLGNIILSVILCRTMGVAGIGIGTLAGTGICILICLTHFLKRGNSLRPHIAISRSTMREIAKYSVIDSGSYLFLALLGAVLNWFVPWRFGPDMLILVSVILFMKELQLVFDGIGEAIKPIMSVYLGEGSYEGIRNCWRVARRSSILEGIAATLILILLAPLIIRALGIGDPAAAVYATRGLRMIALGLTFVSLLYLLTSYYLLRGKILLGLGISALRDVAVAAPMAVIGGLIFGIDGMMAGAAISPFLANVITCCYVSRRCGRENYPLLLKELEQGQKYGFYEVSLTPDEIVGLKRNVGGMLRGYSVPEKTVLRVEFLVEDLFMLIRERNGSSEVCGECTVTVREDGVQIITKDDGELFDLTEDDMRVTSIRVFIVSSVTKKLKENKRNLTTMSYNRNTFFVKW